VCQPPAAQVRAPAPSALCGAGQAKAQQSSGLLSAAEAELAKGGRW